MGLFDDLNEAVGEAVQAILDEGWLAVVEAPALSPVMPTSDGDTPVEYATRANGDGVRVILLEQSPARLQREWGRDAEVTAEVMLRDTCALQQQDRITFAEGPYAGSAWRVTTRVRHVYAGGVRRAGVTTWGEER